MMLHWRATCLVAMALQVWMTDAQYEYWEWKDLEPVRIKSEKPVLVPTEKPVRVPIQKPVRVPIEKPVRVPIQQPVRVPIQQPVRVPIQQPVRVPIQQPVRVPIQQPVRVPIQQPVRDPIQQPVRVPIQQPVRVPIQQPVRDPIQQPVRVPIEKPVLVLTEKPVRVPIQEPVMVPIQQPGRVPIEKPVTILIPQPVRVPIQQPVMVLPGKPVRVPIQEPVRDPIQQPVRVPIEKPVLVQTEKPVRVLIPQPVRVPIQQPVMVLPGKPVRVPIQEPVRPPIQQPVRVPIEQPVRVPIQQPVRVPIQQPVRVPIEQPVRVPILTPPLSPHNCEVENSLRIQCGCERTNTAARCEAKGCCFDGQACFYGKAVTVQLTKDGQFVVVVGMEATLPSLDLDSIHFLDDSDPRCRPVDKSLGFAIYQFPVTACGSLVKEEFGIIIYENRMKSSYEVGFGPRGSITRDSSYELLFQGRYWGMRMETQIISVSPLGPPLDVFVGGRINLELRLANGECFTKGCVETDMAYSSFYTAADYPVTKVLRDPVYVEVRILHNSDPKIVLTLERCWATSSQEPHSMPQWDLIVDGCPYQHDRYQTTRVPVGPGSGLAFPTHHKRFIVKMFTFVDDNNIPLRNHLFIHCSTAMCNAEDAPCVSDPHCFRRRRAAVQRKSSGGVVVSSRAVILTEHITNPNPTLTEPYPNSPTSLGRKALL